jgi:hypothetical protein
MRPSDARALAAIGERQMRICQWGELPACHSRQIRKLEAYATVPSHLRLAVTPPARSVSGFRMVWSRSNNTRKENLP